MAKNQTNSAPPEDANGTAILGDRIVALGKMMLWQYTKWCDADLATHRGNIVVGFAARSLGQLEAIEHLVSDGRSDDAMILMRTLVDRFLLLVHLRHEKEFDIFHKWSRWRMLKQLHEMRSKTIESGVSVPAHLKMTEDEEREYRSLCADHVTVSWREPRPQDIAKEHQIGILYDGIHQMGSMYVHQRSSHGRCDFGRMFHTEDWKSPEFDAGTKSYSRFIVLLQLEELVKATHALWRGEVNAAIDALIAARHGSWLDAQPSLDVLFDMSRSDVPFCQPL